MDEIEKLGSDVDWALHHVEGDYIGQHGTHVEELKGFQDERTRAWTITLPDGAQYRLMLERVD